MSAIHSTLHFALREDFYNLLKQVAVMETFKSHEVLFRKGAPAEGAYLVQSGKVALWLADSPEMPPRIVSSGALLGLPSTIGCRPYSLTAEVIEPVEAGYIPRAVFMTLLQQHHDLCLALIAGLAWEITEAREQTAKLLQQGLPRIIGQSA